jgi:hypothetical protein
MVVVMVVMMVVMMMMMMGNDMPDDAANGPVMVVMVVMVAHAGDLGVAIQPADRLLLRAACRRRVGCPQRRDRVRNRGEQIGE